MMTIGRGVWGRLRGAGGELRAYLGSSDFEEGLNELAARLDIDLSAIEGGPGGRKDRSFRFRHRRIRIKAKAALILERSSVRILKAAGVGSTVGMVTRNPQVALAASLICGGIQAASIAVEAYDSFHSVERGIEGFEAPV